MRGEKFDVSFVLQFTRFLIKSYRILEGMKKASPSTVQCRVLNNQDMSRSLFDALALCK